MFQRQEIDSVLGVWLMWVFQSRGLTVRGHTLRYGGGGLLCVVRCGLEVSLAG